MGHVNIVEMLLNRDIKRDFADYGGHTALSFAAWQGIAAIVQGHSAKGANPDISDKQGRTPLSWPAERGHGNIASLLFNSKRVNPDSADNDGYTPLFWAAGLWRAGTNVVHHPSPGSSHKPSRALVSSEKQVPTAIQESRHDIVVLLLQTGKASPGRKDRNQRTVLSWVAQYGNVSLIELLPSYGKRHINTPDDNGRTPLHWAAIADTADIVDVLLRNGARTSPRDSMANPPLISAIKHGSKKTTKVLLEDKKIDVNASDECGRTALHWAVAMQSVHSTDTMIIARLLLKGAGLNAANFRAFTPLALAAEKGSRALVKLFLEQGAVVTAWIKGLAAQKGHSKNAQQFDYVTQLSERGREQQLRVLARY